MCCILLGEKLWWADQGTDQIGTCDKKDGGNWKVLRNSTSPMMHMKIYNETVQKGAGQTFFLSLCNICFGETTFAKDSKRRGRKICPRLIEGLFRS